MRHERLPIRASVVVVALLGVAACGGTGPSPAATTAATAATTLPATPAPTPGPTAMVVWPAPSDPMDLAVDAGLQPERQELFTQHVHSHLDVFVDGVPVLVPAGIGIEIEDPGVHTFDMPDGSVQYGDITLCTEVCISPLHTHDETGILHTESGTTVPNHLGQLFVEWGVELSDTCVGEFCSPDKPIAFYVDGEEWTGDPSDIELADLAQIAIVIGTPPVVIPATYDFSGA